MGVLNALDSYAGTLSTQLEHRARRHSAIAANIANVDTPGYKAVDVTFKDALGRATMAMSRTSPGHLSGGGRGSLGGMDLVSIGGAARRDGNDVNIDNEMVKLAQNQIEYRFLTDRLKGKFQSLKNAIAGRPLA